MQKLTKWVTLSTWVAFVCLLTAKATFSPGLNWLIVFAPLMLGLLIVIVAFIIIGAYIYFNRDTVQNIFKKNK